jgi:hypothetical protein
MKDRLATEDNGIELKGKREWSLIERVTTDLRAGGRTEMKCELTVVHITWFGSCDGFHE